MLENGGSCAAVFCLGQEGRVKKYFISCAVSGTKIF